MAHFAEIDENNIVQRVIVVSDNDCGGGQFPESEPIGAAFCNSLLGGTWIQTSYNNNFRVRYAGIGYTYSSEYDAFIPPKTYPSWILNLESFDWWAPVEYPQDGKFYVWNEDIVNWEELTIE